MASDGCRWLMLVLGSSPALAQGDAGFLNGAGVTQMALLFGRGMIESVEVEGSGTQQTDIEQWSSWLYVSHGLGESVDVSASIAWIANEPAAAIDLPEDSGLQDARVSLRWRFANPEWGPGKLSLLLVPGAETPIGDYATDSVAAIGDGETTLSYGAVAQYRWQDGPFVAVEGSFRDDLGTSADAYLYGITIGHRVFERVSITAYTYRVVGFGGEDLVSLGRGRDQGHGQGQGSGQQPSPSGAFDLGEIDVSYQMLGFGVGLDLGGGAAITAGYDTTIATENTAESHSVSLGFVYWFGG